MSRTNWSSAKKRSESWSNWSLNAVGAAAAQCNWAWTKFNALEYFLDLAFVRFCFCIAFAHCVSAQGC